MKGIAGIGRKGKPIEARFVKEGCKIDDCRFNCHRHVKREHREQAFAKYWNLKTKQDKWNCICNWVESKSLESQTDDESNEVPKTKKKKTVSHKFHIPVDGKLVKVCKKNFLDTLCVLYLTS